MRALALACLLVVAFVTSVEAVHIHGQWLPTSSVQLHRPADASQPLGEQNCPLCAVGLHASLPSQVHTAPRTLLLVASLTVESSTAAYDSLWHYARFSRPPPAR